MDARCFINIVGGLNCLSHTRPDIAFPISVVSNSCITQQSIILGQLKFLRYVAWNTDFPIWHSRKEILDYLISLIVIGPAILMVEEVLLDMHFLLVQVLYNEIQRSKKLWGCCHLKENILLPLHHLVKWFRLRDCFLLHLRSKLLELRFSVRTKQLPQWRKIQNFTTEQII